MPEVYVIADNIYSPIGTTTAQNFDCLKRGISGIQEHKNTALADTNVYASLFNLNESSLYSDHQYSRFESLLIASVEDAIGNCSVNLEDEKTIFIISSTKGNISLLETNFSDSDLHERIGLHTSATLVSRHFGFVNKPLVISNACISGVMALLTALRLIQSGRYENAVVAGADEISKFILSGFQSFQAVSAAPCKPFDANRTGITLGEGAATMILSSNPKYAGSVKVLGGAISNDANHISAPSRTGEELAEAISRTLAMSGLSADSIDLISAHGTATSYNDEMEAKAIALAGLAAVPANSLKGYYGHTLGAAGLIESIISIESLKQNVLIPTLGFDKLGVSSPINICTRLTKKDMNTCLKTASGFGGCNAAIAFTK